MTQLVAAAVPVRGAAGDAGAARRQLHAAGRRAGRCLLVAAPLGGATPNVGKVRGGLVVAVQPKLSGALPGMRRFFETYPFVCLEQKTSKAVGLKDAKLWAGVANTLPTYLDSDGLAGYFPPRAGDAPSGSDRLTAYVLAATHEAGFELPAPARDAMLAGLAGLRRRPDRAQGLVAAARPRRAQARRDRGAVALRPGAGEDARLDHPHAERLADGGGDRLAQHPEARRRHSRPRPSASRRRTRSCAAASPTAARR